MAGLVAIYDGSGPIPSAEFSEFVLATAKTKHIDHAPVFENSEHCCGAKLDAPCSLHQSITRHAQTGAWLMAAGSVIDTAGSEDDDLKRLLEDLMNVGLDALSRLDGQFVLVHYRPMEKVLSLVADPFGLIPLYYAQMGSRWYVSSSALAVARSVHAKPDPLRTRAYILYGDSLSGTLWQEVQRVPPSTAVVLSPNGASQFQYWSYEIDPDVARLSENQAVECLLESFEQSLSMSLARQQKIWVSLTGGMDSRTLIALAAHNNLPFKTYCHGPRDSRDVQIAETIFREFGWEYEYFPLPENWGVQRVDWIARAVTQSDGVLDALKMTRTIREQSLKAEQLQISLWGYGGEIYRGSYWKQEFLRTGKSSQVNYDRLLDYRLHPLNPEVIEDGTNWLGAVRRALYDEYRAAGESRPEWLNSTKLDLVGLRRERQTCGGTLAAVLGQQRVVLPFYFKQNLSRAISVNYRWRNHSRLFRNMLERINPKLAGMQTADGGPALPMHLSNAHKFFPYWIDEGEKMAWKMGNKLLGRSLWTRRNPGQDGKAYPQERWLQETLALLVKQEILDPDKMCSAPLYKPQQLRKLLNGTLIWSPSIQTMLSRIIAVEISLRIAGVGF